MDRKEVTGAKIRTDWKDKKGASSRTDKNMKQRLRVGRIARIKKKKRGLGVGRIVRV